MKRILFRIFVLGAIVGLGLPVIAHAQRPVAHSRTTFRRTRSGQERLRRQNDPRAYRADELGPVDNLPPQGNPFRGRRVTGDGSTRLAAASEPQDQVGPPVHLAIHEEPADARRQPSGSVMRVSSGEPQLMPTPDHCAVPTPAVAFPNGPRLAPPEPAVSSNAENERSLTNGSGANESGTGAPGGKQLEGPQNAQIVLQKIAPPEIQVGRPAVLRTVVRNTGSAAAVEIEVHDQVPRGTRLLSTAPPASQGPHGELVWPLGTLKPGGETSIEMQVTPTDEGVVGSVATVRFQTEATARSLVTRPKLVVETAGPARVLLGDETPLTFTVSNPGSGTATGVALVEHIPAGLKHQAGTDLEYAVGDLKPGESRQLQLRLKAVQAGPITNVVSARADTNLRAEHRFNLEVASAKLNVAMSGPKRRYLEHEATYQFSVANPGTAPAQQVELVAYLPPGLKFVSANNAGRYDANSRSVYWQMDELPINRTA